MISLNVNLDIATNRYVTPISMRPAGMCVKKKKYEILRIEIFTSDTGGAHTAFFFFHNKKLNFSWLVTIDNTASACSRWSLAYLVQQLLNCVLIQRSSVMF